MKFYTKYEKKPFSSVDYSDPFIDVYEWIIDKETGEKYIGKVDPRNIQDEIDSYENDSDYSFYMQSLIDNLFDYNVSSDYCDFSEIPKTPLEQMDFYFNLEKEFNKLPIDLKKQYDNDFTTFVRGFKNVQQFNQFFKEFKKENFKEDEVELLKGNVVSGEKQDDNIIFTETNRGDIKK